MIIQKESRPARFLGNECRLDERVDADQGEEDADEGGEDDTDHLDALEPGRAVPADSLEHAPEAVGEVEPDGKEPAEIESEDPPVSEHGREEKVGIVLEIADAEEFGKLHLGPEVEEMEADETEDYDSEHEHVACGP